MTSKFKPRNKIKRFIFKSFVIILIILTSFGITFKVLYNDLLITIDNKTYLDYLVNDSFSKFSLGDLTNLSSTEFLLKYSFGINNFSNGLEEAPLETPVNTEIDSPPDTNVLPTVYIYNSHQTESYKSDFAESFNINNTVYLASHILKEYLEDLGIGVMVEENNIVDILNANGWKYASSYKASRILLEQAKKNTPSLTFFIDLHRDSASYERTMTEIDGKKYAKIMFVVGLKHENYAPNLELANILNEKLKAIDSSLSRGVLKKDNAGANGIYNQDFDPNTILIEVGGEYNYIEEVNNTLKLFADILYDYLREET